MLAPCHGAVQAYAWCIQSHVEAELTSNAAVTCDLQDTLQVVFYVCVGLRRGSTQSHQFMLPITLLFTPEEQNCMRCSVHTVAYAKSDVRSSSGRSRRMRLPTHVKPFAAVMLSRIVI